MPDKDKLHYVENRLRELLHKYDEIRPDLLEELIREMAEDIVHFVRG